MAVKSCTLRSALSGHTESVCSDVAAPPASVGGTCPVIKHSAMNATGSAGRASPAHEKTGGLLRWLAAKSLGVFTNWELGSRTGNRRTNCPQTLTEVRCYGLVDVRKNSIVLRCRAPAGERGEGGEREEKMRILCEAWPVWGREDSVNWKRSPRAGGGSNGGDRGLHRSVCSFRASTHSPAP